MPTETPGAKAARLAIEAGVPPFDAYAQLARDGDPWPFVAYQWGRVLWADDVMADPDLPARLKAAGERFVIVDQFQRELVDAVHDPAVREVYCKGNTGCGKGAAAAIAICVYFAAWPDARVVITRDSYETAAEVAYREVETWWRRMFDPPPEIEVQTAGMVDRGNRKRVVLVANPRSDEGFSGVHGGHVLFWFDEATAAVLGNRFALADTQASKFLATANPRVTSGPFYRGFQLAQDPDRTQTVRSPYGLRRLVTADGEDMLNVRLKRLEHATAPPGGIEIEGRHYADGQPIPPDDFARVARVVPGQTGYDVHEGHKRHPDRNWVLCFAHGRFPPEDTERQVVLGSWLRRPAVLWRRWQDVVRRARQGPPGSAALKRALAYCPVEAFGLDVGASRAGDASVLTAGGRHGVAEQATKRTADAGELVAWALDTANRLGADLTTGSVPVGVDSLGVGWGVASMLRERGVLVVEIRGNDPSDVDPKRYQNKRAEMYGELGARLDPDGRFKAARFLLPDDAMLHEELTAPEKIFQASGEGLAYRITPKRPVPGLQAKVESIQERIGRSPDKGDSACYFYRALQCRGVDLSEWIEAGAF